MDNIEAQGARLIVDSSSFEIFPARDPFTPQVPQDEIRVRRVEPPPVKPLEIKETVVPPPAPVADLPPVRIPVPEDIRPPQRVLEPLPDITIAGVVWNTDRPQAIVNGQIVGIGDMVSGVKILGIKKMGITVLFQGRTEILKIE